MNKKAGVVLGILLVLSVVQISMVLAESGSGSSNDSGVRASSNVTSNLTLKENKGKRIDNAQREVRKEIREIVKNDTKEFRREIREDIRDVVGGEMERKRTEFKLRLEQHNGVLRIEKRDVRINELSDDKKEIIAGKINAKTGLNLTGEDVDGNGTALRAILSNGRFAEVKVLPDRAAAVAVARMRAKCEERNCTVELKEIEGKNNQTRAAYVVSTDKESRVLFIFKKKMAVRAEVDSETGEITLVKKPWWAFLAKEKNEDSEVVVNTTVETEVNSS